MKKINCLLLFSYLAILLSCEEKNSEKQDRSRGMPGNENTTFFSTSQLDSLLPAGVKDSSSNQSLGNVQQLGKGQSQEGYYLIKRTLPGYVEMHEQWDDIAIIRSGHGILRTGLKVEGKMEQADEKPFRNWHGGVIADATERKISAGDFIIIPAMTAHQYIPDSHDSLTYWTIKIKRTNNAR